MVACSPGVRILYCSNEEMIGPTACWAVAHWPAAGALSHVLDVGAAARTILVSASVAALALAARKAIVKRLASFMLCSWV